MDFVAIFNADTQDDLKTSYGKFYLICYRFPVFEKTKKLCNGKGQYQQDKINCRILFGNIQK